MTKLRFGLSNMKLDKLSKATGKRVYTFSLLAGRTCLGAKICLAWVDRKAGKSRIVDGPRATVRCFAATGEVRYPGVYFAHKHNTDLLRSIRDSRAAMFQLLYDSVPAKARNNIMRIHVAGDFFNLNYLLAWYDLCDALASEGFEAYAYTKSNHLLLRAAERGHKPPSNLSLTLSAGGRYDALIPDVRHALPEIKVAKIVFSREEAEECELEIDEDDTHALYGPNDFALLLHGTQAKGSAAAAALKRL